MTGFARLARRTSNSGKCCVILASARRHGGPNSSREIGGGGFVVNASGNLHVSLRPRLQSAIAKGGQFGECPRQIAPMQFATIMAPFTSLPEGSSFMATYRPLAARLLGAITVAALVSSPLDRRATRRRRQSGGRPRQRRRHPPTATSPSPRRKSAATCRRCRRTRSAII